MSKYIALLRGINVSGQKKIKMAELRDHLAELPFQNIETYIQSGNIIFNSEIQDLKKLEKLIFDKIKDIYGFEVPTIVLTRDYLVQAEAENPYKSEAEEAGNKAFIAFLFEEPSLDRIEVFKELDYSPDQMHLNAKNLYFYCPNGAGRSKITNNLFESKLKVSATGRNFKTIWKLLELSA